MLLGRRIDTVDASVAGVPRASQKMPTRHPSRQSALQPPQDFKNNGSPPQEVSELAASSNLRID
jgi:hypothetical protein